MFIYYISMLFSIVKYTALGILYIGGETVNEVLIKPIIQHTVKYYLKRHNWL